MQSLMGETPKTALHRFFLVRQHQNLPWHEERELVWVGHTEGGEVFEQTGVVSYEGHSCHCRRIVVQLEQATRDGETQIALLTNLPETDAPSVLVAQLYRSRWRIETLFQIVTQTFHCEIKTLGYPREKPLTNIDSLAQPIT